MKNEFIRFKLERLGMLTILLEFLGALGLLIGFLYKPILLISSGGLALLMFLGVLVRIKVKDDILTSLPAVLFMIINLYIMIATIRS